MKKHKKGKYIFWGIVVILILAVSINWRKIKFTFEMISAYKNAEENKPDDSSSKGENKNPDDIENPILKVIESETGKKDSQNPDSTTDNTGENTNTDDSGKSQGNGKDDAAYIGILEEYNGKFEKLQSEYEGNLDSVISGAYQEYKSGNISNAKLAAKYISEGSRLEKECDAKFNSLIKKIEGELKDKNYNTSIVNDLKDYYNSYKSARREELMSKAKSYMK